MYKTIDLCAGIGGIRRGFELTGEFENVSSAEIDEYAARTYEHLYGENPRNDLTQLEYKKYLASIGYDILLAGFPCQPFSSAGNQEGFDDPTKGTIFFHIKQIINKTRPKAIFLENVRNLVSHRNGHTIEVIIKILEKELNYKVIGVSYDENGKYVYNHDSFVRNTRDFGLPQNRPRAYIMAFDKDLYGSAVNKLPNELPREREAGVIRPSVMSILDNPVDIHYYISATYLQTLERHQKVQKEKGNGFGYCIVNAPERTRSYANTILATGGSGKERNLVYQLMPEVAADDPIHKKKKGGLNNKNIRIMTPKEWGRLQGFVDYGFRNAQTGEDEFSFPDNVPESQQYKQFGNSVSIPVIEEMARFMRSCFDTMLEFPEDVILERIKKVGVITKEEMLDILRKPEEEVELLINNMLAAKKIEKINMENDIFYRDI